jgi:predicted nucleic acid-binding protein
VVLRVRIEIVLSVLLGTATILTGAAGSTDCARPSPGAADLLIAATAEQERLVILCDERDYLGIAAVTASPSRSSPRPDRTVPIPFAGRPGLPD